MEKKPQDSESRGQDKFIVRFPDGMRSRIAEAAKTNGRSMNAEIVHRLAVSLGSESSVSKEGFEGKDIGELATRIQQAGEAEMLSDILQALANAISPSKPKADNDRG
ncbi:Arc family DNA-binding protein [Chromobacterium haemolyticum]|uniref:Arc family DNA-binding protein n=1 Tax=Chromobacterium haemolyticum TaxID=394935 RepID=A0ABS3GNF4_9NEIS|nr:Arc family DNA-binding protein [Chromobacterium haemolyticum]MBK0415194.1 Arc family DNA-binding protein [Chromobacterium haemolyticum]MBO0416591.1 Arc family DNA-binding protein [Chromobacterium haemolyticum]MBO0499833.1 Arc family DNA-binding protein [Chromobacterium haemolyticum]